MKSSVHSARRTDSSGVVGSVNELPQLLSEVTYKQIKKVQMFFMRLMLFFGRLFAGGFFLGVDQPDQLFDPMCELLRSRMEGRGV